MMTRVIRLLVPTASSTVEQTKLQTRPSTIQTLAFLHNGQPHYDVLAPDLLRALAHRGGLAVREYRKPHYGSPAEATLLDDIAQSADAALVGLAC
jgi:hypothetical protein